MSDKWPYDTCCKPRYRKEGYWPKTVRKDFIDYLFRELPPAFGHKFYYTRLTPELAIDLYSRSMKVGIVINFHSHFMDEKQLRKFHERLGEKKRLLDYQGFELVLIEFTYPDQPGFHADCLSHEYVLSSVLATLRAIQQRRLPPPPNSPRT